MATKNEDTKFEASKGKKTSKTDLMEHYNNRFEDAVMDAQYMMIYASTNCPNDIDQDTTKKLINARQRVEKGEKLEVKEEADFWLAYQGLWKLVQPATGKNITAESIKANIPIEKTFFGWLLGNIPFLSRWTETWTISKSRKTVNRHITFTILVLLLLLIFQIYWVVGNQLITELGVLSQNEESIDVQLAEIKFNPNPTADSSSTQESLNNDLDTLRTKQERYTAILRFWSNPWNGLIKVVRLEHDDKFSADFTKLDGLINELENKIENDQDGTKEATVRAQQLDLGTLLNSQSDELSKKSIQKQIDKVSEKSALDSQLIELGTKQEEIQRRINTLNVAKDSYQQQINDLESQKQAIQGQIYTLNGEKGSYQQSIGELDNNKKSIETILGNTTTPLAPLSDEDIRTLPQELQDDLNILKNDGEMQRKYLEDFKKDIQKQLDFTNDTVRDIDDYVKNLVASQNSIQGQIDSLNNEIENSETAIDKLEKDMQTLDIQTKGLTASIDDLKREIAKFSVTVDPEEAQKIVEDRQIKLQNLKSDREKLIDKEQEYLDVTDSRPAQLAGQFVLNILQNYILPILYGLLGAGTSVLRSLSRKINDVTYSEEAGIQHLLSISLGALAGIVVGWFSFLIDTGTTTFLGSVSPLAIAFLVGYNIDPFFSRMDTALKMNEMSQQSSPVPMDNATISKMEAAMKKFEAISQQLTSGSKKEGQSVVPPQASMPPSTPEKPASES